MIEDDYIAGPRGNIVVSMTAHLIAHYLSAVAIPIESD